MADDQFLPGCIFTDNVSQVISSDFRLTVLPNQLQFTPLVPETDQGNLARDKVGPIVELLPHTPYTAAGVNFVWHVRPEDRTVYQFERELFPNQNGPFIRHFQDPDSHFGGYFSRNILDCRLKLDARPVDVPRDDEQPEVFLQLAFNYHRDLSENAVADIHSHLNNWEQARNFAPDLVMSLAEFERAPQ